MFGAIGAKDSYGENKNSFGILRQCLTCEDKKMHEFSTEKVTMAMLLSIQVGQKHLPTRSFKMLVLEIVFPTSRHFYILLCLAQDIVFCQ